MSLENEQELANTQQKLSLLEAQINVARTRPVTEANQASVRSLVQMANQLREEIIRYQSHRERRAS